MRRKRPGRLWAAVEGSLVAVIALILVTIAWFNDPHSLGRLGLLLGAWAAAGWIIWRSVQTRRRDS
jgi:hypothetical protein